MLLKGFCVKSDFKVEVPASSASKKVGCVPDTQTETSMPSSTLYIHSYHTAKCHQDFKSNKRQ